VPLECLQCILTACCFLFIALGVITNSTATVARKVRLDKMSKLSKEMVKLCKDVINLTGNNYSLLFYVSKLLLTNCSELVCKTEKVLRTKECFLLQCLVEALFEMFSQWEKNLLRVKYIKTI